MPKAKSKAKGAGLAFGKSAVVGKVPSSLMDPPPKFGGPKRNGKAAAKNTAKAAKASSAPPKVAGSKFHQNLFTPMTILAQQKIDS